MNPAAGRRAVTTVFSQNKIPQTMRYQVLLAQREQNYQSFSVASIIAFTISVIYILQLLYAPGKPLSPWMDTAYLAIFASLAGCSLFFFLLLHWLHERFPIRFESLFVYLYAFLMVALSTSLTVLDMTHSREYTGMFVGLIAVSVLLSGPGPLYAALSCLSLLIFSLGFFCLFRSEGLNAYLPGLVSAAVSAAIGGMMQAGRVHNEVLKIHLQDLNRELREYSFRDPLTGVRNRRFLMEYLDQQRLFENRHSFGLCVVIFDIDHFKKVNDSLGHPVGDVVLKELAMVTQGGLRDSDMLARYGGEEFMAVLPKTAIDDGVAVSERLRAAVEGHSFPGVPWHITASFGVAQLRSDETVESLISRADIALYWSKKDGRNRVSRAGEHGNAPELAES